MSGRLLASRPDDRGASRAGAASLALVLHLICLLVLLQVPPGGEGRLRLQPVEEAERPIVLAFSPALTDVRARAQPPVAVRDPHERARSNAGGTTTPALRSKEPVAVAAAAAVPSEPLVTPRELLRPRSWDGRLWEVDGPVTPSSGETTGAAPAAAVPASARTSAWVDSAAVIAEARRLAKLRPPPAKPHKRWGFEGGRLHLAGLSLPIPKPTPWRSKAAEEAVEKRAADTRQTFDERVKAIRERKDKEQREKKAETNE